MPKVSEGSDLRPGESVVLEEEIDPNYVPNDEEIEGYPLVPGNGYIRN